MIWTGSKSLNACVALAFGLALWGAYSKLGELLVGCKGRVALAQAEDLYVAGNP